MARINLLPWREELRKDRQKNFLILLVVAIAITGVIMAGVHYYYVDRIEYQNKRNAYLNKEIAKLQQQINAIRTLEEDKKKLQAQLDIIQKLQSSRPEIVHLFDELINTLPEGVYLRSVSQSGNRLSIAAVAQSNARVSSYMWKVEKSNWLADPKLQVIATKKAGAQRISNFTLKMIQSRKDEKKNDKKGGNKK
jgi:type IV pilus assembly protein PilN